MKFSLQLKFLFIFVILFSSKQSFATIVFQDSTLTSENNFEYQYVTAKSGLNFRDAPKGKIVGKFPLNTRVKVVENTTIFETINDGGKTINGEWVGVEKDDNTVYVFNAFLSSYPVNSDVKIYKVDPFYVEENKFRSSFLNLSESYFENYEDEKTILSKDEKIKDTIILNKELRKVFLKKTNVSESDTVFIYEIPKDKIYSFKISDLQVIACINIYVDKFNHSDRSEQDFEFGFDLKKRYQGSYENFAFVGKENPFQTGKLKAIFWEEIEGVEFPENFKNDATLYTQKFSFNGVISGESFKFSNSQYVFYLQNLQREQSIFGRYLVVIDSNTKKIVINTVFMEGESSYLIPINTENKENDFGTQWTGELFKNKPPVVFGFLGQSFGCPSIDFLSKNESSIIILCDNRH